MVYLQGPLALPNNEIVRLRMGRSTLAIKAKRSLSASVRGALHRLPNSTPCTASLERLQEIMGLAPPPQPRTIRLGTDAENQPLTPHQLSLQQQQHQQLQQLQQVQQQQEQQLNLKSDVVIASSSNPQMSALSMDENSLPNLVSGGNSLQNHKDGIDQALILGPERRDGGSGREVIIIIIFELFYKF